MYYATGMYVCETYRTQKFMSCISDPHYFSQLQFTLNNTLSHQSRKDCKRPIPTFKIICSYFNCTCNSMKHHVVTPTLQHIGVYGLYNPKAFTVSVIPKQNGRHC